MSLQVWLPLTSETIENKGISNLDFSNSVAMNLVDDGKIGKCYHRNGSGVIRSELFNVSSTTQMSICIWTKMPVDYTANGYIGGLTAGTSSNFMFYNVGATSIRLYIDGSYRIGYAHGWAANEWHHLAATYNGAVANLYIDGALVGTATGNWTIPQEERIMLGGRSNNASGQLGVQRNNYYNDFRYYDHCLSATEIKEIAQGLVLHYKLDNITNGIQDSSGYGHNGTIIGSPTISTDTIKYSASMNFPANADGILSTYPINLQNNSFTYSFWIKPSGENGGRSVYAASYSGTSCSIEKTTNNKLRFYWDGSPDLSTSTLTITDGSWQHIAIVKNEDKTKVYCYYNGELKDTFTNTFSDKTFTGSLRIGRDTREGATSYNGLMSDFRIYCTALSADDILALYHTAAKIDNLQNLHTFELIEDNSKISLTKNGQLKCDELEENISTKFYDTNIIETNILIER